MRKRSVLALFLVALAVGLSEPSAAATDPDGERLLAEGTLLSVDVSQARTTLLGSEALIEVGPGITVRGAVTWAEPVPVIIDRRAPKLEIGRAHV